MGRTRGGQPVTLTLGLRLEYEQAPTERYNQALTYFDYRAVAVPQALRQPMQRNGRLPASAFAVQGGSVYAGVNSSTATRQNEVIMVPRVSAAGNSAPR